MIDPDPDNPPATGRVSDDATSDDTLVREEPPVVLLPRKIVRDDSLSFTARGLIFYLIAVNEPRSYVDLCAETPTEEHDAIADALDELLGAGLIAQVSQEQFAVHYEGKGGDL